MLDRDAIRNLLQHASIAVLPNDAGTPDSQYTSPLKLFEYLAAGLPIVATDLAAIREIVTEPDNCLFFESGNASDLATKINTLLADADLRRTMRRNNRELSKTLTWERRAETIVDANRQRSLPGR